MMSSARILLVTLPYAVNATRLRMDQSSLLGNNESDLEAQDQDKCPICLDSTRGDTQWAEDCQVVLATERLPDSSEYKKLLIEKKIDKLYAKIASVDEENGNLFHLQFDKWQFKKLEDDKFAAATQLEKESYVRDALEPCTKCNGGVVEPCTMCDASLHRYCLRQAINSLSQSALQREKCYVCREKMTDEWKDEAARAGADVPEAHLLHSINEGTERVRQEMEEAIERRNQRMSDNLMSRLNSIQLAAAVCTGLTHRVTQYITSNVTHSMDAQQHQETLRRAVTGTLVTTQAFAAVGQCINVCRDRRIPRPQRLVAGAIVVPLAALSVYNISQGGDNLDPNHA